MASFEQPLPAGWTEYKDPSTGNPYFHNAGTGETTWSRPAGGDVGGVAPAAAMAPMQQPMAQQPMGQLVGGLPPPMAQQPLPAGWTEYKDPSTGNPYFHNVGTGETTWTRPTLPLMGDAGFGAAMGFPAAQPMGMPNPGSLSGGTGVMIDGIVKNWDDEKGFGFIDPVAGGENVFVHRTALSDGSTLERGARVQYELSWNATKNKHQVSKCMGATGTLGGKGGGGGGGGQSDANSGAPMFGFQAAPAATPSQDGAQQSGTVKTWFDDKGFGFITPEDGSRDCYVHRTFLQDGQTLIVGSTVQYTIQWDAVKNKNNATKVTGAAPGDGKGGGGKGGGFAPMGAPMAGMPSFGDFGPVGNPGMAMSSPYSGGPMTGPGMM